MLYTVKQTAEMAKVSIRTLHYYDEIGLLRPAKVGKNGYRYYDDESLMRLQQILLYREMGMELVQIQTILDDPDFDMLKALHTHRKTLMTRTNHLIDLISTIENTISHLEKGILMSDKRKLFAPFSEEKQKDYEREIRLEYGPTLVNESVKRWKHYTPDQKQAILDEGNVIYMDIVRAIEAGTPAHSIGDLLKRWHQHLRYFYEPPLEVLRNLGELYTTHPDFIANFNAMHPDLGEYMKEAINHYVDELEYAEIERLLAEDTEHRRNAGT